MIVLSARTGEGLDRWPGWWEGGVARAFEARGRRTSDEVIGAARAAARVEAHGIVRAAGFRPFGYRPATEPG